MHRRMQDAGANVEISNPMYNAGDDFDDDTNDNDALNKLFTLDINDKVKNNDKNIYKYLNFECF